MTRLGVLLNIERAQLLVLLIIWAVFAKRLYDSVCDAGSANVIQGPWSERDKGDVA